jgi:phage-related tail fiber protein
VASCGPAAGWAGRQQLSGLLRNLHIDAAAAQQQQQAEQDGTTSAAICLQQHCCQQLSGLLRNLQVSSRGIAAFERKRAVIGTAKSLQRQRYAKSNIAASSSAACCATCKLMQPSSAAAFEPK